jgi:hypothetical protein
MRHASTEQFAPRRNERNGAEKAMKVLSAFAALAASWRDILISMAPA